MSLYDQIRKILNRDAHMTHQTKRRVKESFKLQSDAIDVITEIIDEQEPASGYGLLSGGAVWVSGLTFQVSQCSYIIGGELYNSLTQQVTLADAHATLDRIDVIAVDVNEQAVVVTGTAGADPVKPEIDPQSQVEVTFAYVAALATEPSGTSDTIIYDEDDNWTTTESAATVLSDNTTEPYAGSKHISFIDPASEDYITLDAGSDVEVGSVDQIKFYIKNLNASNMYDPTVYLRFALFNSTNQVSKWVKIFCNNSCN